MFWKRFLRLLSVLKRVCFIANSETLLLTALNTHLLWLCARWMQDALRYACFIHLPFTVQCTLTFNATKLAHSSIVLSLLHCIFNYFFIVLYLIRISATNLSSFVCLILLFEIIQKVSWLFCLKVNGNLYEESFGSLKRKWHHLCLCTCACHVIHIDIRTRWFTLNYEITSVNLGKNKLVSFCLIVK